MCEVSRVVMLACRIPTAPSCTPSSAVRWWGVPFPFDTTFSYLFSYQNAMVNYRNTPINMIQFTSGTTGRPKAATLTNKNLVNNVIGFGKRTGMCQPGHIYNVNVPGFHCMGSILGNLSAAIFQNTCVFPTPLHFNAQAAIEATLKEKCTVQIGYPNMYRVFSLEEALLGKN